MSSIGDPSVWLLSDSELFIPTLNSGGAGVATLAIAVIEAVTVCGPFEVDPFEGCLRVRKNIILSNH